MIPAKIEADRALLRASIQAARPIRQASPLLKAALVSVGASLLDEVDAAIPVSGALLDADDPQGFPGAFADAVVALSAAADDQAALVDMRGTIGRAVFNLRQA